MTIKSKLILLTLSSLLATAIIAIIGLVGMSSNLSTMKGLYNDRVVPLRDLKVIADMYAVNIVDASHKVRNGNITWAQARESVAEAQRVIREQWQGYLKTVLVPEEVQIIDKIKPLLIDTDAKIARLQQMLAGEDMAALTAFTINQLYPAIDPISEQFSALIEVQLTVADQDYQLMLAGYDTNQMFIWMILLLALIIIALIARSVIMNVSLSTQSMNRAMQSALAGDFTTKANIHGQDEIAVSAQALNQLLAALDQAITEANHILHAVAQADFKQQMTGSYVGDLNRLKQGVNASADAVNFMMTELEKVMLGLKAGRFDVQMDAKVPLAFRQLVDVSIGRIEAVVKSINAVMGDMSQGRFSARIEAEAQGDLDQMKRHVNQSLDGLTSAIEQITQRLSALAQGHLNQPDLPSTQFQGQLAELAQAINQTIAKMKVSVSQATASASVVGEAAHQVSQGSSDLSARVQEQASALEETSATMHEMTSAVQTNTDNARRVADLAKQVERDATSGVEVMQQTTTAMQAIRESSHKISDIVSLIDGIAFQTNLLALNAAVEAARAGEMGRGFAVVAGEVRALAQKSATAAKDIKLLISDSVQRVEVGTDLAEKSGQMLTTITGSIQQVAQMIDDIARASQEQTIGIHQVHRAMSDIDRVTQENAALVEQTSAAAESLHHEAEDLRHNMSVFKI